jgi:hypothetical protein
MSLLLARTGHADFLLSDVRCWGQSGKHLLAASISPFDPERSSHPIRYLGLRRLNAMLAVRIPQQACQALRILGAEAAPMQLIGRYSATRLLPPFGDPDHARVMAPLPKLLDHRTILAPGCYRNLEYELVRKLAGSFVQ